MINDYEATKPVTTDAETSASSMSTNAQESVSNDEVISQLNTLIEVCRDGQEGFKSAAEGVERSDLKTTFYEFSQQRAEFTGVLQQLVRTLGGDPEKSGSLSGTVHRGWLDLKAAITGKNEEAVLNECERGEDHAKDTYLKATKAAMPSNVADVISQQYQAVLAAHNRIKALRNSESSRTANSNQ